MGLSAVVGLLESEGQSDAIGGIHEEHLVCRRDEKAIHRCGGVDDHVHGQEHSWLVVYHQGKTITMERYDVFLGPLTGRPATEQFRSAFSKMGIGGGNETPDWEKNHEIHIQ